MLSDIYVSVSLLVRSVPFRSDQSDPIQFYPIHHGQGNKDYRIIDDWLTFNKGMPVVSMLHEVPNLTLHIFLGTRFLSLLFYPFKCAFSCKIFPHQTKFVYTIYYKIIKIKYIKYIIIIKENLILFL